MKELKISELMDDYVDNEVCIEGETCVDNEELKGLVLEQAKTKRKAKPTFKIAVVVAAAACLAGAVGATTVAFIRDDSKITTPIGAGINYNFKDSENEKWEYLEYLDGEEDTLTLENGRLNLKIYGDTIDITDLVDRETPYIYSYTNPDTGYDGYVIAGGTTEEYAFIDLAQISPDLWYGVGEAYGVPRMHGADRPHGTLYTIIDLAKREAVSTESVERYFEIHYGDYPVYDEEGNEREDTSSDHLHDNIVGGIPSPEERDCPDTWLLNALEQIGLLNSDDYVERNHIGWEGEYDWNDPAAVDGYYHWLAHQNS